MTRMVVRLSDDASVEVEGRRNWDPTKTKVEDGVTTIAKKDPPSRVLARDKIARHSCGIAISE